ncbi:MAG: site-specific integrase [Pseudomonadota bacterium]
MIHPLAVTLPAKSPPRSRWLTRSEAAKLLRASSPHLRRFILIGLYTGTRLEAILDLRWTHSLTAGWVDVDNGVIHRQGAAERVTNKRRRSVKMNRRLAAHMRRWARMGGAHVVEYEGQPIKSVKTALRKASKRAKIDSVSAHVLKHTAVTWAFQAGMTLEDASDYFSTTAATLENVYRQHSPEYQHRAVSIMDNLRQSVRVSVQVSRGKKPK